MRYDIILIESDEGFAVGVPALPGCWSQGDTQSEAIANIRQAIADYLAVQKQRMLDDFAEVGVVVKHAAVEVEAA